MLITSFKSPLFFKQRRRNPRRIPKHTESINSTLERSIITAGLAEFLLIALNPDDNIRLIRAEKTKELSDFRNGIDGIPKYLSNTFKIMETAKKRRPEKLLKPADKK